MAPLSSSSAGGTPEFRIFHVASNDDLALDKVTVRNGLASLRGGGGLFINGTAILTDSTVSGNTAGNDGGSCDIGAFELQRADIPLIPRPIPAVSPLGLLFLLGALLGIGVGRVRRLVRTGRHRTG
jgi:hypothetical protein